MKTLEIISSANATIKNVSNSLRDGNREYTSISRVLKDVQRADLMKAGYKDVFEAVGMPSDRSVTPNDVWAVCAPEQWGQTYNKKGEPVGEKWIGIWGTKQIVIDGVKQYEQDGKTPIMEEVLRKVTAWTPTKLFKVLAQAQAIKAQEAK